MDKPIQILENLDTILCGIIYKLDHKYKDKLIQDLKVCRRKMYAQVQSIKMKNKYKDNKSFNKPETLSTPSSSNTKKSNVQNKKPNLGSENSKNNAKIGNIQKSDKNHLQSKRKCIENKKRKVENQNNNFNSFEIKEIKEITSYFNENKQCLEECKLNRNKDTIDPIKNDVCLPESQINLIQNIKNQDGDYFEIPIEINFLEPFNYDNYQCDFTK